MATSNIGFYKKVTTLGRLSELFEFKLHYLFKVEDGDLSTYILSRVRATNNTSKQTEFGRFSDIDDKIFSVVNFNEKHRVHDVAVSSGVTSMELYRKLLKIRDDFVFNVSDIYSVYYYSDGFITRIYDSNKKLVKGYMFNILVDGSLRWKFFLSKVLFYFVKYLPDSRSLKEIRLLDSELIGCIQSGRINFIDYDIFNTKVNEKFTYVRCMNILNLDYFNDDELKKAISNIFDSIEENGYFQVGRTSGGVNNVSVYKKVGEKLVRIYKHNNGSEIEHLIIGV